MNTQLASVFFHFCTVLKVENQMCALALVFVNRGNRFANFGKLILVYF